MEDTWWTRPEQLDKYEAAVVSLSDHEDHLVVGPPGSGKTNLLVLRAAHLYASGIRNIVVLMFCRVLREFLLAGSSKYELPSNRFQTYLGWGKRLVDENELNFKDSGEFEDVRRKLLTALTDLAALQRTENMFDCILLDEAQDYTAAEIKVISSFARRLFAVGDDRQRIYRSSGSLSFRAYSIGQG